MDPLSVTAGVIALTQASVGIGNGIQFLRSLKDIAAEYKDLLDELSNLYLITEHIRAVLEQFQCTESSKSGPALRLLGMNYSIITSLTRDLSQITDDLSDLCDRLKKTPRREVIEMAGQSKHQRVSKYGWQKENHSLDMLRSKAPTTR
jgi:predicted RNase H-like nuclease (RuvC/YqgF family)